VDFKGERRTNDTHRSTTDPEAMLYRKGPGQAAKLCFIGHGLMENRSGLIVDCRLTLVSGHAERLAALEMIEAHAAKDDQRRPRAITLGADKGYDADWFREALEDKGIAACIPARRGRKNPARHDRKLYKQRHRIENLFARLKDWRRIATRYDRCGELFLSAICIAATVMFGLLFGLLGVLLAAPAMIVLMVVVERLYIKGVLEEAG
jgi:transposase